MFPILRFLFYRKTLHRETLNSITVQEKFLEVVQYLLCCLNCSLEQKNKADEITDSGMGNSKKWIEWNQRSV